MAKRSLVWLTLIAVLLIAGCQVAAQTGPLEDPLNDPALDQRVNDYLVEHIAIIGFGGEAFCVHEMLSPKIRTAGEIYIWAYCQEYTLEQGLVNAGSGISLPAALQTRQNNDQVEITGHLVPRDGSYYGPDVRSIFPKSTWPQIMPQKEQEISQYNSRAKELMIETRNKAGLEYNIEIED